VGEVEQEHQVCVDRLSYRQERFIAQWSKDVTDLSVFVGFQQHKRQKFSISDAQVVPGDAIDLVD
jgi:hypothetical protein